MYNTPYSERMTKTWRKVAATTAAILTIGGGAVIATPHIPLIPLHIQRATATTIEPGVYPLADEAGVTVKTIDGEIFCGEVRAIGCHVSDEPDTVYIQSGFEFSEFMVAHEVAHVLQYRLGIPFDECAAEAFAEEQTVGWASTYPCRRADGRLG